MANIREPFSAPDSLGLRPTEIGTTATAAAARRVGGLYSEAAESKKETGARFGRDIVAAGDVATKYVEHQEINHGAVGLVGLQSKLTQDWNNAAKNADPNDTTIGQKFIEGSVNPLLDNFKGGFLTEGGQKWAEGRIEALRTHLSHKAAADMSTMAAASVGENVKRIGATLSNTARLDPSSVNHSLDTIDATIDGLVQTSPNLDPAHHARIKKELGFDLKRQVVLSGLQGKLEKNPEAGLEEVKSGRWGEYISGADVTQLQRSARYYARINDSEAKSRQADAERVQRLDFTNKAIDLERKTMPQNVGDDPALPRDYWERVRELSNHPAAPLELSQLKQLQHRGEALTARMNKPDPLARVSHETTMDLLKRMRATDDSRLTDNGPIYEAYQQDKLSNQDFNFLTKEFANLRTPDGQALDRTRGEFAKTFARMIDGNMTTAGTHSMLGTQRMYEFQMDARREEENLRRQGKDPHLVYDPRSEHYWGKPENIARYHVSMQEANKYDKVFKAMSEQPAPAPGQPASGIIDIPRGMTPAEVLKKYPGKRVKLPDGRTMDVP